MNKPNMSRYNFWNKQTLGLVLGVALVGDISKAVKGAINCEGLCRVRVTVLERGGSQ